MAKNSLEKDIKMGGSVVDILKIITWILVIAVYGYFFGYGDNLGQLKEVYLSVPHLIVGGIFFVLLFVLNFIGYKEGLRGDLITYSDYEFYNSLGAEKKYEQFGKELKKVSSYISTCRFMKSLLPALKVVFILIAFAFGWGYIKSKFSVILFLIIAVVSYILNIICSKIELKFASGTVGRKISSVADSFKKFVLNTDNSLGYSYVNGVNNAKLDYIKKNRDCFSKDNIEDILNNIEKEKVEELKELDRQKEEQKQKESEDEKRKIKEKYKDVSDTDIENILIYKATIGIKCNTESIKSLRNTTKMGGDVAIENYNTKIDLLDKLLSENKDNLNYERAVELLKEEYKEKLDNSLKEVPSFERINKIIEETNKKFGK